MRKSDYRQSFFVQNRLALIMGGLFSILAAGTYIAIAFLLQFLIDVAVGGTIKDMFHIAYLTLGLMGITVAVELTRRTFVHKFYYKGLTNYKAFAFRRLLANNLNAFSEQQTGKYLSGLSNDVNTIETQYLESFFTITTSVALFAGGLLSLFFISFWIGLTVVGSSILPISVSVIFGNRAEKKEKIVSEQNDRFISSLRDILGGFSVIKSFKAEPEIHSIFVTNDETLEQAKRIKRNTISNVDILSEATGTLMLLIVIGVGVWLSIHGKISAGSIVACVQLMNYITGPAQVLPTAFSRRKAAIALIQKMEDTLEHSEEAERHISVQKIERGIRFENVAFGYEQDKMILNGVNCFLKKGCSYAIVGISGSGKTTMLNLLTGAYSGYSGDILLDDQEIKDISMESLYTLTSVVQQNVFIFDDDIVSNITMYKSFPQDEIDRAIDCSGLRKLISEKGLEYKCGEGGSRLSGGERQRISIARAILKNMQILLMDEATSALDDRTANEVEDAILNLNGITRIVVTHKYHADMLKKYDEIVVVKDGIIEEMGPFEDLLHANGYFASLYRISGDRE